MGALGRGPFKASDFGQGPFKTYKGAFSYMTLSLSDSKYNRVTTRLENLEYLEMSWNSKNRQRTYVNEARFSPRFYEKN